jgi:DNA-binding IclR family transcriptional regulator
MSPGLRNVLDILAELAHNNTETDVFESNIISQSGLPKSEVQIYLNELESRRFAEEVRPRPTLLTSNYIGY